MAGASFFPAREQLRLLNKTYNKALFLNRLGLCFFIGFLFKHLFLPIGLNYGVQIESSKGKL